MSSSCQPLRSRSSDVVTQNRGFTAGHCSRELLGCFFRDVRDVRDVRGVRVVSNFSFRTKSSGQYLLEQFFSNSASETILLNNSSSASVVDVFWSAARNTLNSSRFVARYLYSWGPVKPREAPTSGYLANLLNADQWGCLIYHGLPMLINGGVRLVNA